MTISREGYKIIAGTGVFFVALNVLGWFLFPQWLFIVVLVWSIATFALVMAFFRVPSRPLIQDNFLVYAPADGKVVVCEEVVEKEFINEKRIQLSIFMSVTNVHMNWFPIGGKVVYFRHHHGKFMVAWHPKSSEDNERTTTVVDDGRYKILFRQVAGLVARRIVSYAKEGQTVEQNIPCGFIKFGSRLDVMLPADCEILVGIGDKVTGSQTPIARLK